jgi:hypothetical protein
MTHTLKRRALSLTLALALIFSLFVGLTGGARAEKLQSSYGYMYGSSETIAVGDTVTVDVYIDPTAEYIGDGDADYGAESCSYLTGTFAFSEEYLNFVNGAFDVDLEANLPTYTDFAEYNCTINEEFGQNGWKYNQLHSIDNKYRDLFEFNYYFNTTSSSSSIKVFTYTFSAIKAGTLTDSLIFIAGGADNVIVTVTPGSGGGTTDPTTYAVSSYSSANGSVTSDKETAEAGETVTLTVAPSDGYQLKADSLKVNDGTVTLSQGENDSDGKATYTFTMPDGNVTVTAEFETVVPPVTKYNVNFSSMSNGTVTADKTSAAAGETVTLTVAPSDGYQLKADSLKVNDGTVALSQGENDSDGKATYTFTMPDGNVTVTAEFETVVPPVTKYNVNFSSMSNGTVTADKSSAAAGETVTLTVAPSDSYRLKIGGIYYRPGGGINKLAPQRLSETEYSFTMPANYVYIDAEFELIPEYEPEMDANGFYKIGTVDELKWFASRVSGTNHALTNNDHNGGINAILTNNITVSASDEFTAIGQYITDVVISTQLNAVAYNGTFDGNGKSITFDDMTVQNGIASLFVNIGSNGVVKNLTVKGSIIKIYHPSYNPSSGAGITSFVGGIAANSDGLIENCAFDGTISNRGGNVDNIGGIVGNSTALATIKDCTAKGTITGNGASNYIGGIVGKNFGSIISCKNEATISGNNYIGGIVGQSTGNIDNSENTGDISGKNCVGGIGGNFNAVVTKSINSGKVQGVDDVGGLIGSYGAGADASSNHRSSGNVNFGEVSGVRYVGGLIGWHNWTMENSINFGNVSGNGVRVGGISGSVNVNGELNDCFNAGAVTNTITASEPLPADGIPTGGIVGYFAGSHTDNGGTKYGSLKGNYNVGLVTAPNLSGDAAVNVGVVAGSYGNDGLGKTQGNYYSVSAGNAQAAESGMTLVAAANMSFVGEKLREILDAAGIDDEVKYNDGDYPVPERLWDHSGDGQTGPEAPVSVQITFNVTPENAVVKVFGSGNHEVSAQSANVYLLETNGTYTYTVSASGYTQKSGSFNVSAARTFTVALELTNPDYAPGWAKWRPSFGIYITNRDGTTGTRIGNWNYDTAQQTYVDANGNKSELITDFSSSPLLFSGVDRKPAARLGVVLEGIYPQAIVDYYNSASGGSYPEITAENYTQFIMNCATNSNAAENPYTSNSPSNPGKWDWFGAFDYLSGTNRYYYEDFLIGVNDWGNATHNESANYTNKPLGAGQQVDSILAVKSYNSRIIELPSDGTISGLEDRKIDSKAELQNAVDYLLSVADTERALRNFEGMAPLDPSSGVYGTGNPRLPLGMDGSYWIGSVWITPPYRTITFSGDAGVILTGAVDYPKALAGETVTFHVSAPAETIKSVKLGGEALTANAQGDYSFTMPDSNVTVTVKTTVSSDATLKSLTLSEGTLSPAFSPSVTSYTVTVANSVSDLTVNASANDINASVSGADLYSLTVGVNTIAITVTAEDGITTQVYTITVTRKSGGGSSGGGGSGGGGSSNAPVTSPSPDISPQPSETPVPTAQPIKDIKPVTDETIKETVAKYDDIHSSSWFAEAAAFTISNGLMSGTEETTFAPLSLTTRAMIITVLARISGEDTSGGDTWYSKAVEWAKIQGISDGSALNDKITREQLVTMLWRFSGEPKATATLSFADAGKIRGYASEAVRWAVEQGIITGYEDNTFRPQNSATRAETAVILQRWLNKYI